MNLHQAVSALSAYHPRIKLRRVHRGAHKGKYGITLNYPAAKRARRDGWIEPEQFDTPGGTLGFLAYATWIGAKDANGNGGWFGTKTPEAIRSELRWKGPVPKRGVSAWHLPALEWLANREG